QLVANALKVGDAQAVPAASQVRDAIPGDSRMQAVVVDHEFVVDEELRTVVGGEPEVVPPGLADIEVAANEERKELDAPRGLEAGITRLESARRHVEVLEVALGPGRALLDIREPARARRDFAK